MIDQPVTFHAFPDCLLEVPRPRAGRPGYVWVQGYAVVQPRSAVTQAFTRRHWHQMAKRDGFKLKFHPAYGAARDAAGAED